jgi:hypothetical protein
MSSGRIILAGILGGLAMFIWTSIAHIATPLGMTGIKVIPNEQAVLSAMQTTLGNERGFYLFPGTGAPVDAPQAQQRAAMANYQQILDKNPSGILIYKPAGEKAVTPSQLASEFGFQFFEALMLAILLSLSTVRTFRSRMGVALAVGLIAAVSTNLSYWNWYGFPGSYTSAAMFVEAMKYLVAGAAIALLMGKTAAKNKVATA